MAELPPLKSIDREFYAARIRDFLPQRLIDAHTHVWRKRDRDRGTRNGRAAGWPALVADENPIEDLLATYRLLLPGKEVRPLIFATVPRGRDLERMNAYVSRCSREHGMPALIFSHPQWSAATLERKILEGGFLGAKSYLSLAPPDKDKNEVTVFDFFPHPHLEMLDQHGWIAMLHLPRDGRLRDPVNLQQLLEIERRYPRLQLIVAHVGRAYCREDVGEALERLADTERLVFDFSANTNAWVFARALRAVGPRRLLFGSDLPILRLRMRRICEGGRYVNLVPRGLYGDVGNDPHMREVNGAEAEKLTFFLYEEIDAMRRAVEELGLSRAAVEDMFRGNAERILQSAEGERKESP